MYGTILIDGHYKVGCEFNKADDITVEIRLFSKNAFDKVFGQEVQLVFRDDIIFEGEVDLAKIIRWKNWNSNDTPFAIIKKEADS